MFEHVELTNSGRLYGHTMGSFTPPIEIESITEVLNTPLKIESGTTFETVINVLNKEVDIAEIIFKQSLNEISISDIFEDMYDEELSDDELAEYSATPIRIEVAKKINVFSKKINVFSKYISDNVFTEIVTKSNEVDVVKSSINLTPIHLITQLPLIIEPETEFNVFEVDDNGIIIGENIKQARRYHTDINVFQFYSSLLNSITINGLTSDKIKYRDALLNITSDLNELNEGIIGLSLEDAIKKSTNDNRNIMYVVVREDETEYPVPELTEEEMLELDAVFYVVLENGVIVDISSTSYGKL